MNYGNLVNSHTVCRFLRWELHNPVKVLSSQTMANYNKLHMLFKWYLAHPDAVAFKSAVQNAMNGYNPQNLYALLTGSISNTSLGIFAYHKYYLTASDYLKFLHEQSIIPFSTIKAVCIKHNLQVKNASMACSRLIKSYAHAYLSYDIQHDTNNFKATHSKFLYRLDPIYRRRINKALTNLNYIIGDFKSDITSLICRPCTDDSFDIIGKWTDDSESDVKINGIKGISLASTLCNMYKDGSSFYYEIGGHQYSCQLDNYAKIFYYAYEKFNLTYINIKTLANTPCLSNDLDINHIIDVVDDGNEYLTNPNVMADYQKFGQKISNKMRMTADE